MSKIRYLTQDNAGKKLRRSVPQALRELAGKSAWTLRVDSLSYTEIKKRANIFAVDTDHEIEKLRGKKRLAEQQKIDGLASEIATDNAEFYFTKFEAEQLALLYFHQKEQLTKANDGYATSYSDTKFDELLEDARWDLENALKASSGEVSDPTELPHSRIRGKAVKLLIERNYFNKDWVYEGKRLVIPSELRQSDAFVELCGLLERADVELASRRKDAIETRRWPQLADHFFQPSLQANFEPKKPIPTIAEVVAQFKAYKEKKIDPDSLKAFNIPIRAMMEEWGERTPITDISVGMCDDMALFFVSIPSHVTQHYGDMTIRKAIETYEAKNGPAGRYDAATLHIRRLKAVFEFARRRRMIEENPAEFLEVEPPVRKKMHEKKYVGYHPFTLEELRTLFNQPLYTGCRDDEYGFTTPGPHIIRRHRYWAQLIALWTGMRMGEVLQMEKGEVRQEGDIWYFAVTDEEQVSFDPVTYVKSVKNKNAVRDVPVHPVLVRLGLIDWVKGCTTHRLFPEAKPAKNGKLSSVYTKRANTLLRSAGIWQNRKKVFHSLRGNFTDALRAGRVDKEYREAMQGWEAQKSMDSEYGKGHKIRILHEEISKAHIEGLDLSHLYPENIKGKLEPIEK